MADLVSNADITLDMNPKPKSIDDYLARVSDTQRAALEKLRRDIKGAVPSAEECISYHMPGFRLGSRMLVTFGAAKNHCAFYPAPSPSGSTSMSLPDMIWRRARFGFPPKNRFQRDW